MIEIQHSGRIPDERMKEIFKAFRKRADELEKAMKRPTDIVARHEQANKSAYNAYQEYMNYEQ